MRKNKIRFPLKGLLIALSLLWLLYYGCWRLGRLLNSQEYFSVKEVVVKGAEPFDVSCFLGKNIFSIDLEKEQAEAAQAFPGYRRIRFVRVLPSRLYVEFIGRIPVAYLKLYRYFCLDEEAVIFNPVAREQPLELPVIKGLEGRLFPKEGKRYNLREIASSLEIISAFGRDRLLRKNFKITEIDVSNLAAAWFSLQGPELPISDEKKRPKDTFVELQVKIGQEDFKAKIKMLATLLAQTEKVWYNIKYIDLRFNDPAIKYKDVK